MSASARGREERALVEELLENNAAYADGFDKGDLPVPPAKKVAVITCMDARIDVHEILGLKEGDAHVIRNAGGVVTDDVIRSLTISQRMIGTEEIVLIHHTRCALMSVGNDEIKERIERDVGVEPPFAIESYASLEDSLSRSIDRIKESPFIQHRDRIHSFVYDVETGVLTEARG